MMKVKREDGFSHDSNDDDGDDDDDDGVVVVDVVATWLLAVTSSRHVEPPGRRRWCTGSFTHLTTPPFCLTFPASSSCSSSTSDCFSW